MRSDIDRKTQSLRNVDRSRDRFAGVELGSLGTNLGFSGQVSDSTEDPSRAVEMLDRLVGITLGNDNSSYARRLRNYFQRRILIRNDRLGEEVRCLVDTSCSCEPFRDK